MLLSCVCDIMSIFVEEVRDFAFLLHHIADFVFYTLLGCMTAQVLHEVEYRQHKCVTEMNSSMSSFASKDDLVVAKPVTINSIHYGSGDALEYKYGKHQVEYKL